MAYSMCAEEIEGRWIVHVPSLPGCFASDERYEDAIARVPTSVETYIEWCRNHEITIEYPLGEPVLEERIRAWSSVEDYEVNAFFAMDRPPVKEEELPLCEWLLNATKSDLQMEFEGGEEVKLQRRLQGERWSIIGILGHVVSAEQWYLSHLGFMIKDALPEDPLERFGLVHEFFIRTLPQLVQLDGIFSNYGETWSARKVLRRALWHRRDHTMHIGKLKLLLD
jgi:predicted RNase H-like HicB family nuclease